LGTFFVKLLIYWWLEPSNLQHRFCSVLLAGLGYGNDTRSRWQMCRKHGKYRGLCKVSLFQLFGELDAVPLCFGCLFNSFWGTLGSIFRICKGLGDIVEFRWFYTGSREDTKLRAHAHFRVTSRSLGVCNNQTRLIYIHISHIYHIIYM
jgi:hypothetical protein